MKLLISLLSILPAGNIYQCEQADSVVYAQHPCGDDALKIDEDSIDTRIGAGFDPAEIEAINKLVDSTLRRQRIDLEIARIRGRSDRRISGYASKRDACVRKIPRAANNLAGAVYQKSLRECQASYDGLIADEKQAADLRIDRLRHERSLIADLED